MALAPHSFPEVEAKSLTGRTYRLPGDLDGERKASNQWTTNQTETAVNFNAEFFDTADLHDESTLNSRLVAPIDGVYHIAASIHWAANTDGNFRRIRIRKNGAAFRAASFVDPRIKGATFHSVETLDEMNAGDYLEVVVEQDSGGPLDVSLAIGTEATIYWLGPVSPAEG